MEEEIKKLNKISSSYKKLTQKVKLYSLLTKAKEEYDKCDYKSGRKTLNDALELSPYNPEIYRGLGCIEQFDDNFPKALEYFFKALKYSKEKEIEYTLIGMVYYLTEDFENSLKYFDMAIQENDDYPSAYEGKNQAMLEYHVKILDLQEALDKLYK